jgi:hypothetical protein
MLIAELEVAFDVGRHFDALGVVWLIGGSVASSLLGEPRATADIDVVADIRERHVGELHRLLASDYYIDDAAVRWAVSARRSFNVIHQASITKVDIFCCKDDDLARDQLARRIVLDIEGRTLPVSSAEDTILQKLLWFEDGSRVSERQWHDALGVLRVRGDSIDEAYIERHASVRGIAELWNRLRGAWR